MSILASDSPLSTSFLKRVDWSSPVSACNSLRDFFRCLGITKDILSLKFFPLFDKLSDYLATYPTLRAKYLHVLLVIQPCQGTVGQELEYDPQCCCGFQPVKLGRSPPLEVVHE